MNRPEGLAVVLPAHNSAAIIKQSVSEVALYFESMKINGQIIVVENGSSDNTWEVISSLDVSAFNAEIIRTKSEKGLGNAFRQGLSLVSKELVLLTADDLPFGFSDLQSFFSSDPHPVIAVGSKAHAETIGSRTLGRRIMSLIFRKLRHAILGINLGDTQGSIMGNSDVIREISKSTSQPGYLMTTELLTIATKQNIVIEEVPVEFQNQLRKSNINVIEDSIKMLRGLFEIRKSLQTRKKLRLQD